MPKEASAIIISSVYHLPEVIQQADFVVSALGGSDKMPFPDVGRRPVLRLTFDDVGYSSGQLVAASRQQIADLIEFARSWSGKGAICIHCRAGSSRSPALGMIAAAALGRPDSGDLALRVRTARAYYRPNETCLKIADGLLGSSWSLVNLSRSVPVPTHTEDWRPATIPLTVPNNR